jgi:glutaminyl-peptide cyclotransferase
MNLLKKFLLAALTLSALYFSGCKRDQAEEATEEPPTRVVPVPKFYEDTAFAFVEKQVNFGPRVPNTDAHRACREWLVATLRSFGADVIEQEFKAKAYTGETLDAVNIIAQFNPKIKKRVLLAAHWDTRHIADSPLSGERRDEPILGADDGGSGVAVLLEVARQLQANPIDMGVDIVLFDAEDYGESNSDNGESFALGSQHWSRNLHTSGYRPKYGILLDMVGARGARFAREQFSVQFAPNIVNKVWKLAQGMGYGNYFVDESGGYVTDDHYFVNTIARIPMIDIINRPIGTETGFGHYWHTHDDNLDIIDKRTLRAVGQVILAVVYRENNGVF